MANRNKYMGKVAPLKSHCLKKVQFQQQANFGRPWRRTFRFSEDGRVEETEFPCLEQESGQ